MPEAFYCFVRGIPTPQGSKRGFIVGERVNIVDTNPRALKDWRAAINFVLQSEWKGPPLEGPVCVALTFKLPRPKSTPKKRFHVTVKPDLDKLIRAAFDAMTGIVFLDDKQVAQVHATKRYSLEPGVQIDVDEMAA